MRNTAAPGGSDVIVIFWSSLSLPPVKTIFVQPVKTIPMTARHSTPPTLLIIFLIPSEGTSNLRVCMRCTTLCIGSRIVNVVPSTVSFAESSPSYSTVLHEQQHMGGGATRKDYAVVTGAIYSNCSITDHSSHSIHLRLSARTLEKLDHAGRNDFPSPAEAIAILSDQLRPPAHDHASAKHLPANIFILF